MKSQKSDSSPRTCDSSLTLTVSPLDSFTALIVKYNVHIVQVNLYMVLKKKQHTPIHFCFSLFFFLYLSRYQMEHIVGSTSEFSTVLVAAFWAAICSELQNIIRVIKTCMLCDKAEIQ